jgi:hypothetical protein
MKKGQRASYGNRKGQNAHWWILGAAAAAIGGGIWWYEANAGGNITLVPGTISVKSPGATSTLHLPANAQAWVSVGYQTSASGGSSSVVVPASATGTVSVASNSGASVVAAWTDSTGATQTTTISFT